MEEYSNLHLQRPQTSGTTSGGNQIKIGGILKTSDITQKKKFLLHDQNKLTFKESSQDLYGHSNVDPSNKFKMNRESKHVHNNKQKHRSKQRNSLSPVAGRRNAGGELMGGGMTCAHLTRKNIIHVPEEYANLNFDTRIKQITGPKTTSTGLTTQVIETWINETLMDAEHLDIQGLIMKPEHQMPLQRYSIDRMDLRAAGVDNNDIDRIYRGLFVYSIGFYEMLQKSLVHAKGKYTYLSSIWKVFAILLEYCCKSNYQMLITKINQDHMQAMEDMESKYSKELADLESNKKQLIEKLDELSKEKDKLEIEKKEEHMLRVKLQGEFEQTIKDHEEEVQLRLQFESKLNSLHALHRDLQARYDRANESILLLETEKYSNVKLIGEQKEELLQLRDEKVKNQSQIKYQDEKISSLITQNELKITQLHDLEEKNSKVSAVIEERNLTIKDLQQQITNLQLKQEAEQALINGLMSEKQHLELGLKENKTLKDQYSDKCEQLQKMHEDMFEEMQEYKKQLVGIQEIKKDRDQRLDYLRKQLDESVSQLESLKAEHSVLKVQHQHMEGEHQDLLKNYSELSDKLAISNRMREEKIEMYNKKLEEFELLQNHYEDRGAQFERCKKELELTQKRLKSIENENTQLEIKKESIVKQSDIQRKQLMDRISQLGEIIAGEKDSRELWTNRFEAEQRLRIQADADVLSLKSRFQDSELQYKNQIVTITSLEKSKDLLKQQYEDLQTKLSRTIAQNENLQRDLFTKTELLRTVEDQHRIYIKKLREDFQIQSKRHSLEMNTQEMMYEDLRNFTVNQYEFQLELQETLRQREQTIEEKLAEIDELEKKLQNKIDDYNILFDRNVQTTRELKAEKDKTASLEADAISLKQHIDELKSNIILLEEELLKIPKLEQIIKEKDIQLDEVTKRLEKMIEERERELPMLLSRGTDALYPYVKSDGTVKLKKRKPKTQEVQTQAEELNPIDIDDPNRQQQLGQPIIINNNQAQQSNDILQGLDMMQSEAILQKQRSIINQMKPPRVQSAVGRGLINPNQLIKQNSAANTSTMFNSHGDLKDADQLELIKSANYMHMIPSGDAIVEESVDGLGRQNADANSQVCIGLMKKQQSFLKQAQLVQQNSFYNQRNAAKTLIQTQKSQEGILSQGQQTTSGQTLMPAAMIKHQAASKQNMRVLSGKPGSTVQSTNLGTSNVNVKQSNQSTKDIKDEFGNDIMKSVYDLRMSHAFIAQRPMTHSTKVRRQNLHSAVTRVNKGALQQQYMQGIASDTIEDMNSQGYNDTINAAQNMTYQQRANYVGTGDAMSGSISNTRLINPGAPQVLLTGKKSGTTQNQMYAPTQNVQTQPQGQHKTMGTMSQAVIYNPQSTKSQDMSVKGRGSIRTLIRLANARE